MGERGVRKGGLEGRQGEAKSSFDLPFEGRKEEKVVINSLLFIPPSHSLSLSLFFNRRERAEKSYPTVTRNKICGYRRTGK